jgi:hypothetical protein
MPDHDDIRRSRCHRPTRIERRVQAADYALPPAALGLSERTFCTGDTTNGKVLKHHS